MTLPTYYLVKHLFSSSHFLLNYISYQNENFTEIRKHTETETLIVSGVGVGNRNKNIDNIDQITRGVIIFSSPFFMACLYIAIRTASIPFK